MRLTLLALALTFLAPFARADDDLALGTLESRRASEEPRSGWGGKSDTELKSALDDKGRTNGYEIDSEWNLFRLVGPGWGPLVGLDWKRDYSENLDFGAPTPAPKTGKKGKATATPGQRVTARNYTDYYYGGARAILPWFGRPVVADLVYDRVGEEQDRIANAYDGYLTADFHGKARLADWAKLKLRIRYIEYFRTRDGSGIDTRQTRVEATPAFISGPWSTGLQNRLTHRFRTTGSRYYADTAPFFRYENRLLEFTLKAVFTPLVSGDGRTLAQNWSSPTYSADLVFLL